MADALGIAFAYLNRRERTVAEVRARLQGADFADGEIELTIAELCELGYLNDARFARIFAEDKRELEQWGRERIARGLAARGIERELIAHTLATQPADDELTRAVELLGHRFPEAPRDRRDRERAFGVLVRKGYDSEIASDAVRAWDQMVR